MRNHAFFQRFGRFADVVARLFELPVGLGHARLVFRLLHAVAKLVDVAKYFLLLVAQPLELALQLLLLFLGPGFFQCGLQLFQTLVQVLLALGQLLEPVEHLVVFAPLLLLLLLEIGLPARFVAVFSVVEFELLELLLRGAASTTAASALWLLAADDVVFAGPQAEQRLKRLLLGEQRRFEVVAFERILGGGEMVQGVGHVLFDFIDRLLGVRIAGVFANRRQLLERRLL
jgi:hypothetical protein